MNKYQDATAEQMQALLAIRGDFSASEAKEVSAGGLGAKKIILLYIISLLKFKKQVISFVDCMC